jgi:DNA-binding ferritin-like protein
MMTTIGLDDEARREAGQRLNFILADQYVLHATTRGHHGNACAVRLNDAGTADFLPGLVERHEPAAGLLRSQVENTAAA